MKVYKVYIERNALRAELEHDLVDDVNIYNSRIDKEIRDDKYYFAMEVLDNAPIADVREVIHAKWEREYDIDRGVYWHRCSHCGCRPPRNQWGQEYHSNYCPQCGARMEVK